MAIDIYHSRRTKYERCPYYTDAPNRDLAEWVLKTKPAGFFYAQPVYNITTQGNPVNNVMMFDKSIKTLKTSDDVPDLKRGCVILHQGQPWVVDNTTQELHLKESEFGHDSYETYISIRR